MRENCYDVQKANCTKSMYQIDTTPPPLKDGGTKACKVETLKPAVHGGTGRFYRKASIILMGQESGHELIRLIYK